MGEMAELKIEVVDPVICKLHGDQKSIRSCMRYESDYWVRGPKRNYRKAKVRYAIVRKKFHTGLLPRVLAYCKRNNIPIEVEADDWHLKPDNPEPFLPGITFRPDQLESIHAAVKHQRGLIIAPTGSGKTIVAFGISSMFPDARILVLCHNKSIIRQTFKKAAKYNFDDISLFGGGSRDISGKIAFGTIQTLTNMDPKDYGAEFDIVIIDECHHVAPDGQYENVLSKMLAPIRIGFTATRPKDPLRELVLEGLTGPIIGELTIQEGIELNILAHPTITLVPVPFNRTLDDKCRSYQDYYQRCIVSNRARNRLIVNAANSRVEQGKSVLIMIKELLQGDNLIAMAKNLYGMNIAFVQGATEDDAREELQEALNAKEIKCVISSAVWREGIDIPSLNSVIYASGGRSDTMTLQIIGRGLRRTDEKDQVEIVDFLDSYRYLSAHTVDRIKTYVESGWL